MAKIKILRSASDKSISHRAVMLSAISKKRIVVKNFLFAEDTLNTIKAFLKLGVDIKTKGLDVIVSPNGKYGLKEPDDVINMGNSGTGMRLLTGILSGFDFLSVLSGDESLRSRPMMRIAEPLSRMGAEILYRKGGYAPLAIKGRNNLNGIYHKQNIASAQVKSSVLLAGLYSDEDVSIEEPGKSRNHTENMLKFLGVDVKESENLVSLGKEREPFGDCKIDIPADISSSAFFIVYAALKGDFELVLKDVGLNKTRIGILDILSKCNVNYEVMNRTVKNNEPFGDLLVKSTSLLKPFVIDKKNLPSLIDEIPILSVLAAYCDGVSVVKDASELRKKESDRIRAICENLSRVGVKTEEFEDGFKIYGNKNIKIKPAAIRTYKDHRIAMSFIILSALADVNLDIDDTQSIKTSYPGFFEHLDYMLS